MDWGRALWEGGKARAGKKGVRFTVTLEQVRAAIPKSRVCPVLGIPMERAKGGAAHGASPTLDRIDPTKGYVPGNIAVISYRANTIKSNATVRELEKVARWLRKQSR